MAIGFAVGPVSAVAMIFKVALLQISPYGNDQGRNLAKGLDSCRRARALGADLALFPELWSVGSAKSLVAGRRSNVSGMSRPLIGTALSFGISLMKLVSSS